MKLATIRTRAGARVAGPWTVGRDRSVGLVEES